MNPIFSAAVDVQLDVALGAMPFEERAVNRAASFHVTESVALQTCSAEDLIVFKAFAGRPQDWVDIEGVARRQSQRLNGEMIWQELVPLLDLKEDDEAAPRLRQVLEHIAS